jgi:hypothetical protein
MPEVSVAALSNSAKAPKNYTFFPHNVFHLILADTEGGTQAEGV